MPPGALPADVEQSAPFAERARRGFVASFVDTWKLAVLDPSRFFRQVRVGETSSALLFGVIAFTIGTWGSLVFRYLTASATVGFVAQLSRRMGNGRLESLPGFEMIQQSTAASFLAQLVMTPILGVTSIYVTAGIVHLLLLVVRGAPRGFPATLTVVAYANGVLVLEALPVCGGLIAIVWFLVIAISGLSEAQRCGHGKATFAVLMPLLLMCVAACATGALLAAFLGTGGGAPPPSTGI